MQIRLFLSSVLLLVAVPAAVAVPAEDPVKLNVAPEGFTALFNGKDLTGWTCRDQKKTVSEHQWKVVDGILTLDWNRPGRRGGLYTDKEYGDFILYVDWKFVPPAGDSGIIFSTTQIQIGNEGSRYRLGGSGGMWYFYGCPRYLMLPVIADHPAGEWNTFLIKRLGGHVTVHLNDTLVVNNLPEWPGHYKERDYIELQHHGGVIWFRNIFIKELPATGEKRQGPANQ